MKTQVFVHGSKSAIILQPDLLKLTILKEQMMQSTTLQKLERQSAVIVLALRKFH